MNVTDLAVLGLQLLLLPANNVGKLSYPMDGDISRIGEVGLGFLGLFELAPEQIVLILDIRDGLLGEIYLQLLELGADEHLILALLCQASLPCLVNLFNDVVLYSLIE